MDSFTNNNNGTAAPGQQNPGMAGEKKDFGDKAFDALAKKSGHPVDRNTSEKITDAARGAFEKVTGKKVNPKISN
ncbi:hypothetical protein PpBr36_03955 [Pyricularia pennisetigena]|uniref:hypothetical protein n=1 Tax=Pyricularia pennisetigena TaxID=1578925 RepID=UPI0011541536|nr:hypothetical protein PpBr36_03955 [Pyricularia pennisetigena]TLS30854.1 hypothetical protein PpBr36_03955 [Pyricularia pennisetigena]